MFDPCGNSLSNGIPLIIAKFNFERLGYCHEQSKSAATKPQGFQKDRYHKTSIGLARSEWMYFLTSLFVEVTPEHHELLDFFIDVFTYKDLVRTKEIFENVVFDVNHPW